MSDRPLNILMLAPTPFFADRGCHVRIFEEARSLIARGHDVRIVTYHLGRDLPGIPTLRTPPVPWYSRLEAGPSWHKPHLDLLLYRKALELTRTFRPDIIHAHLHEGALIGRMLKKSAAAPLLFDYQGSLTGECIAHGFFSSGSLTARSFASVERFINRGADHIITSSTLSAGTLTCQWGEPPGRVTPLIDGVDTSRFTPLPPGEGRRRFAIPDDRTVVAYLGLLNSYQGTDLLLAAIALLKERRSRLLFLIMGFPHEPYRQRAEELGISDMVCFTGRVDYGEAPLLLCAANLAVSPKISLDEANGKLFNYMACGLPTAAFDTPVNREILGDAGRYARLADPADLARLLEEMAGDPAGLKESAARVREMAVREHSWDARADALEAIYRRLQGDGGRK